MKSLFTFFIVPFQKRFKIQNQLVFYIFGGLIFSYAIFESWGLRWLCDDSFISFTYSRNLVEGRGLVFNENEYVEGFSNFLWTIGLSFFELFGFSSIETSLIFGILSFAALLIAIFRIENENTLGKVIPILFIQIALFRHNWIFATSGLETMSFVLFVSLGFLFSKHTGFWFCLASLSRPEGILFFSFYLISEKRKMLRYKNLILMLILLGFGVFRYITYGEIFPNTFFAKANKGAYFLQGFYYLLYFLKSYPFYLLIFILSGIKIWQSFLSWNRESFLNLAVILYFVYVLYIGGDFMGMRFWLPILPYLSYLAFTLIQSWDLQSQIQSNLSSSWIQFYIKNRILIYLFFILSSTVYNNPLESNGEIHPTWNGIGEERKFYDNQLIDSSGYGQTLDEFRIAFFGAQAHFMYALRPKYAFEGEVGLTDKDFAKKPVDRRGRIGHEGKLELSDLKERNIELLFANKFPDHSFPYIVYTWRKFPIKVYVLNYQFSKFVNLCSYPQWNCDLFFNELKVRNLDKTKSIEFY